MRMAAPSPCRTCAPALLIALLGLAAHRPAGASAVAGPGAGAGSVATYRVHMSEGSSRIVVTALLPVAGARLGMATSRPAGIAELDSLGWPGLVTRLRVSDPAGNEREVARDGERGWKLARPDTSVLSLEYEIDFAPLERLGWPAPREAAYREAGAFVLVGRSLFVTSEAAGECRVTFELPSGWHATAPWRSGSGAESFVAAGPEELEENLLVLSREHPDDLAAAGFRLHVFPFGHWAGEREQVRRTLRPVVRHYVAMMADTTQRSYVVVLLPAREAGGESYRASFALNTDTPPGAASRPAWGNTIAHEIFHLWNGWLLRGADYTSTQWFQEGFTEYAANIAIATSGQVGPDWLRGKLATHVGNSRRLATTLEAIGSHKGPPLYSAGALVAFTWDMRLREATQGRRDLGDFFRELMRRTDGGRREYAWPDLRAALEASAPGDWEGYYQSYIRGDQRLPVEQALAAVGQRLAEAGGHVRVEADPAAPPAARARWAELLRVR